MLLYAYNFTSLRFLHFHTYTKIYFTTYQAAQWYMLLLAGMKIESRRHSRRRSYRFSFCFVVSHGKPCSISLLHLHIFRMLPSSLYCCRSMILVELPHFRHIMSFLYIILLFFRHFGYICVLNAVLSLILCRRCIMKWAAVDYIL